MTDSTDTVYRMLWEQQQSANPTLVWGGILVINYSRIALEIGGPFCVFIVNHRTFQKLFPEAARNDLGVVLCFWGPHVIM